MLRSLSNAFLGIMLLGLGLYITRAFVRWVRDTGMEVQKLTGHEGAVSSVAVTPDGRYIVSGGGLLDKTVRVWERDTGKEVQRLTGHQSGVLSVAVTPDGRYIVSGSHDKTVRVWSIEQTQIRTNGNEHIDL